MYFRPIHASLLLLSATACLYAAPVAESKTKKEDPAPSFQKKQWTGTKASYEGQFEYNFVGGASQNMGNGRNDNITEHYFDVRQTFLRRTMLAFLVQLGSEYEHMGFNAPQNALIPDRLDQLEGLVAIDFRWSRKDMVRLQTRPGIYSDFRNITGDDFNSPVEMAYTRVVSNSFQWVVGLSINTLRKDRYLPGGGLRWQINERWKLKFFMPSPQVEYRALPNLHLHFGADVRAETFRVSKTFGRDQGDIRLDNGLVDYQEFRVGPGFSWNIKPLIALRGSAGYMIGRQFDFHTGGPTLQGSGAPYVNLSLYMLFKLPGDDTDAIPQNNRMTINQIMKYF